MDEFRCQPRLRNLCLASSWWYHPRVLLILGGLLAIISFFHASPGHATEPWIIDRAVTITEPTDVGDVVVVSGGSLVVTGVPEPGFRVSGNLIAIGNGEVRLLSSMISFLSVYHGQYALIAADNSSVTITNCEYRVPASVQHGLVAYGSGRVSVRDTDFGSVQLVAARNGNLQAARLNGYFEVILQDDAHISLQDIPRTEGQGALWVWPEFGPGSVATYTPPLPGFISNWSFPPAGSTGIAQTCTLKRCNVLLWPLLARPGCDLTLQDIPSENFVVAGFHVTRSQTIEKLQNGLSVEDEELPLKDRRVRLLRATIDTFNLYPQKKARVTVRDSTIGELLAMDGANVVLRGVTIDGSGGYFGALDKSKVDAEDCTFTCDVQAAGSATIALHSSMLLPYPQDPTGASTRYGAFDNARLLLDTTPTSTTAALGGRGLIAACWISNPPPAPPGNGSVARLRGTIAQYSLDSSVATGKWRLEAKPKTGGGASSILGEGSGNVQERLLGTWTGADTSFDYQLRTILIDGLGRKLTGRLNVPQEQRSAGDPQLATPHHRIE